MIYIELCI